MFEISKVTRLELMKVSSDWTDYTELICAALYVPDQRYDQIIWIL